MRYANRGIIPPNEWNHDPELKNKDEWTVALLLAKNHICPPK